MPKTRRELVEYPIKIRKATNADIGGILSISRQYPRELDFVRRVSLEDSLGRNSLLVADYFDTPCVGFVNYRTRRDGWSVIYEIATHKNFLRKGVGSFLLNAVPFPVKLKCPVDNESNKFYAQEGMTLENTERGRKRELNVWSKRRSVILCQGSSKSAVESVVHKTSFLYGTRHTEVPVIQPFMVDIKWDTYDWQDYLDKIKHYKPVLALAPDFTDLTQLNTLLVQIQELQNLCIPKIAVCPKFDGAINLIPDDCIVAISVPTKYAGFLPNSEEIGNRKVHLLGGSPQQQLKLIEQYNVVSTDLNCHTKNAFWGVVYDGSRNVWTPLKQKYQMTYDECILLSSQNIEGRLYDA